MKLKLLWRRLSVSAPRMAVTSRRPWWMHALIVAGVVGVAGMVALWTFDLGRRFAGSDGGDMRTELARLRDRVESLEQERDALSASATRSASDAAVSSAARDRLASQLRALEGENAKLKDDLAFYERMVPAGNTGVAIRSFRVENEPSSDGMKMRFRLLVSQGAKPAREFVGSVQLVVAYAADGRNETMTLPAADPDRAAFALSFRLFQRVEGVFSIPSGAVVQSVQVRVLEGGAIKAQQTAVVS